MFANGTVIRSAVRSQSAPPKFEMDDLFSPPASEVDTDDFADFDGTFDDLSVETDSEPEDTQTSDYKSRQPVGGYFESAIEPRSTFKGAFTAHRWSQVAERGHTRAPEVRRPYYADLLYDARQELRDGIIKNTPKKDTPVVVPDPTNEYVKAEPYPVYYFQEPKGRQVEQPYRHSGLRQVEYCDYDERPQEWNSTVPNGRGTALASIDETADESVC